MAKPPSALSWFGGVAWPPHQLTRAKANKLTSTPTG